MFARKPPFSLCIHCFRSLRRPLTTSTASPPTSTPSTPGLLLNNASLHSPPSPPPPPRTGHTLLTTRRLIALSGHDAARFLHGLTTTNIPSTSSSSPSSGFYSAFLNAAGRVLHDVFIYPTGHSPAYREWLSGKSGGQQESGFLIEVDAEQVQTLASHLKKFKLRANVQIRVVEESEWGVWSAWGQDEGTTTTHSIHSSPPPLDPDAEAQIGCEDLRAPGMGRRIVLPGGTSEEKDKAKSRLHVAGMEVPVGCYTVRRILHGVAEGQAEIVREKALPLESNLDYMGGIDFRKGCYVGQELTIRTRHTGVVRKRILPVLLNTIPGRLHGTTLVGPPMTTLEYVPEGQVWGAWPFPAQHTPLPPRGAAITKTDGKKGNVGKWLGGVGNVGLALCKLQDMTGRHTPHSVDLRITWESGTGAGAGAGVGASKGKAKPEEKLEENNPTQEATVQDVKVEEVSVMAFVPSWHPSSTSEEE